MSKKSIRSRFLSTIDKYLKGKSTPEQNQLVDYFYNSIPDEKLSEETLAAIKAELKQNIDQQIGGRVVQLQPQRRFTYLKIASCLVLMGLASLFVYQQYFATQKNTNHAVAKNNANAPVIVLKDGESYDLRDSLFGKMTYKLENEEKMFVLPEEMSGANHEVSEIKNPTDRIFAFQLHDGTKAWLNPNSTLEILPITDGKRVVKIDGTVLFDVQKIKTADSYMPFVVKTDLQTIEVLGTKFIVNSFDKKTEDVLLLEGKVKLTHNIYHTAIILKPDQKASLQRTEAKILITKSTDAYKVEAWHKGLFHFENEKITDVMEEMALWYNEEIVVDKHIRDIPITGMISRYKDIDQALRIIEMTNNVKCYRSQGKIYVK